jgi:peptide deformylase
MIIKTSFAAVRIEHVPKCRAVKARSYDGTRTDLPDKWRDFWHNDGHSSFAGPTTEIMTIRPIVRYPDPRLALPAPPVTAFDGALRDLATDLTETMQAAPGIGITAPHIGIPLRVVVLELDAKHGARTYVNPEIEWASSEMIMHREGSVSMPGATDEVQRHARVRIAYQDIDGNMLTEESEALRAVCHQHEIDQLDGMFWLMRLSRLKRERLVKKFEKTARD